MGVLGGIGLAIVSGLLALSLSLFPSSDNWPIGLLVWATVWAIIGAICGMERRVMAFALGGMVLGYGLIAMVAYSEGMMISGLIFGTPLGALVGAVVGRLEATRKGWGREES